MTNKELEIIFDNIQWECKYVTSINLPEFYIIWHKGDNYTECSKYFNIFKEIDVDLCGFDIWRSVYLFEDSGGVKIGVTQSSND
jgi:hypothetical protein